MTLALNSSALSQTPSASPVPDLRRPLAEALEEIRAARKLIEAQGLELKVKDELIALEKQLSEGLKHYKELSESEIKSLRIAVEAKDKVIAAYEAEIVVLKKQRTSFWKKAEIFIIGVGIGAVIIAVKK